MPPVCTTSNSACLVLDNGFYVLSLQKERELATRWPFSCKHSFMLINNNNMRCRREFCVATAGRNSHDTDISSFSCTPGRTLVASTLKLLVGISYGSSAHAGQFFIAQALDFFVASPRVSIDVARITAAKFIFDYCCCVQHSPCLLESWYASVINAALQPYNGSSLN